LVLLGDAAAGKKQMQVKKKKEMSSRITTNAVDAGNTYGFWNYRRGIGFRKKMSGGVSIKDTNK
jgi:hypothetical protein